MVSYSFTLYVVAESAHSQSAIANLEWICSSVLDDDCTVTIIDVADDPAVAERQNILATPTLVKTTPPPEQRLIGDLTDRELVLRLLGITNPIDTTRMDRQDD